MAAGPQSTANPNITYLPQLDVLRAVAVFLVFLLHWLPMPYWFEPGAIGVTLFFVLSGYLISKILLKAKDGMQAGPANTLGRNLRQFYMRRALRIFPIYFLVVGVLLVIDYGGIRQQAMHYLLYLVNYIQPVGKTTHLWTLGVEEQFYIGWPLLLLVVPRRRELALVLFFLLAGLLFRGLMLALLSGEALLFTSGYTPACLDAFGFGALLALAHVRGVPLTGRHKLLIGVVCAVFYVVAIYSRVAPVKYLLFRTALSGLSFVLLAWVARPQKALPAFFRNRWLLLMGKVSYGLYLYHNFMPEAYAALHHWAVAHNIRVPVVDIILFPVFNARWQMFPIYLAMTIATALLSWHLIEKPLNNLKRYFPY